MKFVSAKKPVQFANELESIRTERMKLQAKVKELLEQEEMLTSYLERKFGNEPFQFNGEDGYVHQAQIVSGSRRVLNIAKIKSMLGDDTPYRKVQTTTVKFDYVYE